MARVGEDRVARGVDRRDHGVAEKARQVDDVRLPRLAQQRRQPRDVVRRLDMAHGQALVLGVRHDVRAMWLAAAAHQQLDTASAALELRGRGHRHQPPFVRVEAADLEPEVIGGGGRPEGRDDSLVGLDDRLARDAVRDHDRVLAPLPHPVLHVAAHRGHGGREVQREPVDAVEAERVVGVPQHHRTVAQAAVEQRVGDELHRPGGMPLLAEDDDLLSLRGRGLDDVADQARRKAVVPVANLALLPVVDPAGVLGRDPLAPAAEMKPSVFDVLFARHVGVATEIEVCRIAHARERARETFLPDAEPAGLAVLVWSLEAQEDENGPPGIERHLAAPTISRASA